MASRQNAGDENHTTNGLSPRTETNGLELRLQEIPDDMPEWRKIVLQRKNDKILEEMKMREKQWQEEELERTKWDRLPQWKVPILKKKESVRKEYELKEEEEKKRKDEFEAKIQSLPPWQQELMRRKTVP